MSINTGTDISNLSPNTSYTFYCYPINQNGQYDPNTYQTGEFKTKPKIDSLTYSVVSATQIDVTIVGGAFSSVKPYYSDTGITPYTQFGSTINGSSVTTIQYTNLTPNQRYWFSMTPYNGSNYDGTSNTDVYVDDANCVTWANITEFTNSSNPTTSEISVKWSGTYSKVKIDYYLNSTNTLLGSYPDLTSSDTPKNFSSLSSNTEYKFIITPYNSLNVEGTQTQFIKKTALDKILNYTGSSFTYNTTYSQIYTFTSDKSFTITTTSNISGQVIIVGGGGGGGTNKGTDGGGGGGAGRVGYGYLIFKPNNTYYITIGSGGAQNSNGNSTIIKEGSTNIAEAVGGGYGGYADYSISSTYANGGSGGSGGGATGWGGSHNGGSNTNVNCATISFYGYDGGGASKSKGGSGGGAGGAGGDDSNGGAGKTFSDISSAYFGGGGGCGLGQGSTSTRKVGGSGGGGSGGLYSSSRNGNNATANTGGGGGGSGGNNDNTVTAGSGGSGIVIIAFN